MTKTALIFGATSAIAQAVIYRLAKQHYDLFLVARNKERLSSVIKDCELRHKNKVFSYVIDANDYKAHEACIKTAIETLKHIDIALIAYGTLPEQEKVQTSFKAIKQALETNFTSQVSFITHLLPHFQQQQCGTIAVISSVAGDRGRQSNYIYGSAKAAMNTYLQGLRNQLYKSGVHVLTIKPGFVDTPMTAKFKKGLLWAQPDTIARSIVKAIQQRKDVIYTPSFWWWIMFVIKCIPEVIFKRLSL